MKINACFLLVKKEVRTSQKLYSSNPVKKELSITRLLGLMLGLFKPDGIEFV